jgi:hypothetical protein
MTKNPDQETQGRNPETNYPKVVNTPIQGWNGMVRECITEPLWVSYLDHNRIAPEQDAEYEYG